MKTLTAAFLFCSTLAASAADYNGWAFDAPAIPQAQTVVIGNTRLHIIVDDSAKDSELLAATVEELKKITSSEHVQTQTGQESGVTLVPEEYNRAYDGDLTVHIMTATALRPHCEDRPLPYGVTALACAFPHFASKQCDLNMPLAGSFDLLSGKFDALFFHERGHCEGYTHPVTTVAAAWE